MTPLDPAPTAAPLEAATRLDPVPGSREDAARRFEGLFLSLLVKEMRQTLSEGGLFGDGPGASVYEGFFDQMMADSLAQGRGTGLRDAILASWPEDAAPHDGTPAGSTTPFEQPALRETAT